MAVKFHLGYGVATIGYLTGIFILSSLPGEASGHAGRVLTNLLHLPMFFGLALCLLLTVSGGQWDRSVPYQLYWAVGLLGGTYAAFDEWHQSFVASGERAPV
jgi:VanZ family protein